MTDPHHQSGSELLEPEHVLHPRGYTICLRQADVEWMAGITGPVQRPSIILAADQDPVLAKTQPWIEAHSKACQEHP